MPTMTSQTQTANSFSTRPPLAHPPTDRRMRAVQNLNVNLLPAYPSLSLPGGYKVPSQTAALNQLYNQAVSGGLFSGSFSTFASGYNANPMAIQNAIANHTPFTISVSGSVASVSVVSAPPPANVGAGMPSGGGGESSLPMPEPKPENNTITTVPLSFWETPCFGIKTSYLAIGLVIVVAGGVYYYKNYYTKGEAKD